MKKVLVSIVSHGHSKDIFYLLEDFSRLSIPNLFFVITINDKGIEDIEFLNKISNLNLALDFIYNKSRKSFSSNHNSVGLFYDYDFIFVLNPDIRIEKFFSLSILETFSANYLPS
jgi:hypothetical protein